MTHPSFPTYFNETHEMVRETTRRFVQQEILPHIAEWEEAGTFPRELYRKGGELGILGIGHPEHLGRPMAQRGFRHVVPVVRRRAFRQEIDSVGGSRDRRHDQGGDLCRSRRRGR